MNKYKVDLELALPAEADACEACIERLLSALRDQRGITSAHVDRSNAEAPKLCLHYDPTALRIDRLEKIVEAAGVKLKARFEHLSIPLDGILELPRFGGQI
jgi:Zn2+/Cd2+-exporting ATPase